jgi:hypothetical protein
MGAADVTQREKAAVEEELLLARAQVKRMGALWEAGKHPISVSTCH